MRTATRTTILPPTISTPGGSEWRVRTAAKALGSVRITVDRQAINPKTSMRVVIKAKRKQEARVEPFLDLHLRPMPQ
jgi:hypothetical protein